MSIQLYEHNRKAYESALSMMADTNKAAIIHPTGTGKFFIGFKLAEEHSNSMVFWGERVINDNKQNADKIKKEEITIEVKVDLPEECVKTDFSKLKRCPNNYSFEMGV